MFVDPLGLWCWGDPINDDWFNFSVGVADDLSLGSGRLIRNFTQYANEMDLESLNYRAGLVTGRW